MPITTEFWATTAQVIPALLLAFVVTHHPKELKKAPLEPFRIVFSAGVLVSLALGVAAEFLALDGLLGGGGPATARIVIIAIGVLAFWVVLFVALWAGVRFVPEGDDALDHLGLGRAAAVLAVVAGQVLFAIVVAILPLAAAIWLTIRM